VLDDLLEICAMSPTVLRHGPFRFYFFSREEPRPHVHVQHPDGEAKIWLHPSIELAQNFGLTAKQLKKAIQLVEEHEHEIREAWQRHFGR
jgi:hypothetical protein